MENMEYDKEQDRYLCRNGKMLTAQYEKREKIASGYKRTITVYQCSECKGCPFKTKCIKGNRCKTPMEERQKVRMIQNYPKTNFSENEKDY